jgi:hypothetical protein
MPTEEKPKTGLLNGRLWGVRALDWAELQEPLTRPVYDAVFQRVEMNAQTNYLDVGCGCGLAAQLATERGAKVTGLMHARTSLLSPNHEWRPDSFVWRISKTFNVVTGFNSFQIRGESQRRACPSETRGKTGGYRCDCDLG